MAALICIYNLNVLTELKVGGDGGTATETSNIRRELQSPSKKTVCVYAATIPLSFKIQ